MEVGPAARQSRPSDCRLSTRPPFFENIEHPGPRRHPRLRQTSGQRAGIPAALHKPFRADQIKRLQQRRPQQLHSARSQPVQSSNRAQRSPAPTPTAPRSQSLESRRMITPHPRLQIKLAIQLAHSIIAATQAPSPKFVGAANGSRYHHQRRATFFQRPARTRRTPLRLAGVPLRRATKRCL